MPTITKDMIDAAQRVMIRHTLAEGLEVKPADVTGEMIDAELAELREIDKEDRAGDSGLTSLDGIFEELLTAALNAVEVPA